VRGVEGGVSGRTGDEEPTSLPAFLHWMEDGNSVNDEYSGMRLEDVVTFLNGLTWRSSNHQDGFEPPRGGDLRLVREVGPPTRQAVLAEFRDPDVEISADTATVSWADGRSIYIRSRRVSQGDLRRVVDGVATGTGQDIDRLVAAAGADGWASTPACWTGRTPRSCMPASRSTAPGMRRRSGRCRWR
jgi:hypothetical protein